MSRRISISYKRKEEDNIEEITHNMSLKTEILIIIKETMRNKKNKTNRIIKIFYMNPKMK